MATYSNNTTIKFVSNFSVSASNGSSSYSVPAGHFAVLGFARADSTVGSTASVVCGGVSVVSASSVGESKQHVGDAHFPEGTTITASSSAKGASASAFGAVFKNTP